jgi:hypothetical protein
MASQARQQAVDIVIAALQSKSITLIGNSGSDVAKAEERATGDAAYLAKLVLDLHAKISSVN